MLDKETEARIKMMAEDYEFQTRGIPQRLDHVLYAGLERGLQEVDKKEALFNAQTEEIVKTVKKSIRNSTYEQLKQIYFDYDKLYNKAVEDNRSSIKFKRFLMWLFGLASIGSPLLGIATCFFDYTTIPEFLKPFSDGGGILMIIPCIIFGIIWWIFYSASLMWGDPELSGMAGRYARILNAVENKLNSKKFVKIFNSDPDFKFLQDYDEDDYDDEEELYEDELGNYYADDDPENPKNQKEDNRPYEEKYGFTDTDTNLDKAMKIKKYCEENDKLFSKALLQRVLKVGYYKAGELQKSIENQELED